MRKLILLSMLLSGCATVSLVPQTDLLVAPSVLMTPVQPLQPVADGATATDALKVVVSNYAINDQLAAEVEAWQNWYTQTNANITKQNALNVKKK